jgi:hypothetical protein
MTFKPFALSRRGLAAWLLGLAVTLAGTAASAQTAKSEAPNDLPSIPAIPVDVSPATTNAPLVDPNVQQAGCAHCGGLLRDDGPSAGGSCADGSCAGGACRPGPSRCFCGQCNLEGPCGRIFCELYDCICCPDPCYAPHWMPIADSAFFVDAARPVTQLRLRWDNNWDVIQPDRAEFFWAQQHPKINQVGAGTGKGPAGIASRVDYFDLSLYAEAAAEKASVFVETPYRHLDVSTAAISANSPLTGTSGFADMNVGTKALILDCELLQLTFQFKTYIPTGNFLTGLGTGHVSLEPSFLFGLKLTEESYLQGQISYWIPIGGDSGYQGNIFHSHFSYNHTLCSPFKGLQLVGTLEAEEWTFLGGDYTDSDFTLGGTPVAVNAKGTIFSAGPGLRLFICDKLDIGVGTQFSLTGSHFAGETARAEFRWRF